MRVDFDNLRRQAVKAFNSLVKELNGRIQSDGETICDSQRHGDPLCVGDIREQIDSLRDCIAVLICIEDPANDIVALDLDLEVFAPEEDTVL